MFGLLFSACAYTVPTLTERPLNLVGNFLSDGGDTVFTVVNPLPYAITATVLCVKKDNPWIIQVPAKNQRSGIGQIMEADRTTGACWVDSYERSDGLRYAAVKP